MEMQVSMRTAIRSLRSWKRLYQAPGNGGDLLKVTLNRMAVFTKRASMKTVTSRISQYNLSQKAMYCQHRTLTNSQFHSHQIDQHSKELLSIGHPENHHTIAIQGG